MKKCFNSLALLFLVLLLSHCSDEGITDQSVYDFNGGFENSVNNYDQTIGWSPAFLPNTADYVNFIWGSDNKHSGQYSVSIYIKEDHPRKDTVAYNWTKPFKPFKEDQTYLLKGWIKTLNLKQPPFIVVQCWDSKSNMIGFNTSQNNYPFTGTNDWTEVRVEFTPPQNTNEVRLRLGIVAPFNNGGKVWFDDISIE